jgi:multicomponent Na+:H+ antiporter subunit F
MSGPAIALGGLLGLVATGALAAALLARAPGPADRLLLLQLLGVKAVAGCLALAAAFDQPALADAGVVLALLGAVAAAAFGQGGAAR